jgi:phage baseplate assembly protein W
MNIKIGSVSVDKATEKSINSGFLYKDLSLDLQADRSFNSQLNKTEYLKDVAGLYDVEAIRNSITNAFLTSPGQKILNPTYGVDLRQYLFEPVDDYIPSLIETDILENLPNSEPRIEVVNVTVTGDEENNQYDIELQINVPSLGITGISIKSTLATVGYVVP